MLKKYLNKLILLLCFIFCASSAYANEVKNFRQVEATGRSVFNSENIELSRKRALEDALYLAALKGGANINGFSSIGSNTVINDQSIVRATNNVIDFKILEEKQDNQFLIIKISAVVGNKNSSIKCQPRPINITMFRGMLKVNTDVPSKLGRKLPAWSNNFYQTLLNEMNVELKNYQNTSIEQILKSNINPIFDYNAITNGIPNVQAGDYSLVPELNLVSNSENNFSNYLLRIKLHTYKGPDFEAMPLKTYNFSIDYKFESKFQFITNITTSNIENLNSKVKQHMISVVRSYINELKCRPLEGKLKFANGILTVDLGKKQGLKFKQIGLVNDINIKNSMLSNSSVIIHVDKIYENHSEVLLLNDKVKQITLDKLNVEFVE